jgi:hypothetical protein
MGRKSWASSNQRKWLENNIPRFYTAKRQKRLGDFFEETISAFFQAFPLVFIGQDVNRENVPGVEIVLALDLKTARNVRILSLLSN